MPSKQILVTIIRKFFVSLKETDKFNFCLAWMHVLDGCYLCKHIFITHYASQLYIYYIYIYKHVLLIRSTAGSTAAYCFLENVKTWDFNKKRYIFLWMLFIYALLFLNNKYQSISFSALFIIFKLHRTFYFLHRTNVKNLQLLPLI